MKKFKFISYFTFAIAGIVTTALVSCEREFSEDITLATFPTIPEVFTDNPVNLTDEFFISFDPADGANVYGFDTDNDAYKGTQAIKIDVPAPNDPNGGFIGGIFLDRGEGRNLSEYTALTFWAKGSTTATVGLFGFGTDFIEDKYTVSLEDTTLSTAWKKYIIPIPDPSKLVQEKGMFIFSAGTQSTGNLGYSIWLDEIRFEKLNTFAQARTSIMSGLDVNRQVYNGEIIIDETQQTVNLGDGTELVTNIAPAYLDFHSSDPTVVQIDAQGKIIVVAAGTATITASFNGVEAGGSLIVESKGEFISAPTPTQDAADVISIFSDTYENVNIDFYNGYWKPYQTTTSADFDVRGDNILVYENFNFVGHQFSDPTVDASAMTHLHMDILIPGSLPSNAKLIVTIKDFGANGADGGGDDKTQKVTILSSQLKGDAWASIDIPLSLSQRSKVGQFIFENGGSAVTNLYMDNVYFYKQ
jgi:hypothetical protein